MKTLKKMLLLVLAMAMLLSIAACAAKTDEPTPSTDATPAAAWTAKKLRSRWSRMAPEGVIAAYGILTGEAVDKEVWCELTLVSAENVDEYLGTGLQ